jgi:hypothetical protein
MKSSAKRSETKLKTVYAVRTIPIRDATGIVLGWVRVDLFADGSRPTDTVYRRDGTAQGQHDAARRVTADLSLLWPTRDEAVRDGIARLREANECR